MPRKNQFSTPKAIRANFKSAGDANRHAGVPIFAEPGCLWVDDSYRHVQIIGNTGEGKTECVVKPTCRDILHRGESLILLNCKDEVYRELAGHVPDGYQTFHVNFSDPWHSPDFWNPLLLVTELSRSQRPEDQDQACTQNYEFWTGVESSATFEETFWPVSAVKYLTGLTAGLLELAEPQQVNLETVESMMVHGEENFGARTYTHAFYDMLPENHIAKNMLSGYVFAARETRMSMYACATIGLAQFGLNHGLRQLLMRDTVDIAHLDIDRPFAFFVTMPQESGICTTLASLLVNQLISHLVVQANRRSDRRLPIRTHVVLEEMGKVGKCIPTLPDILPTCRSLGMRFLLVMQSSRQLAEAYGQAKADTVQSCTDIRICFSTSCSDTLQQWSNDCGYTEERVNGVICRTPLITPTELRGMDVGEALVMTKHLKFRTRLPFYYQLTAGQDTPEPVCPPKTCHAAEPLNFCDFIKERKRREMMDSQSLMRGTATGPDKRNADGTPMLPSLLLPLPSEEEPEELFLKPPTIEEINRLFDRKRKERNVNMQPDAPKEFNVIVLDPGKKPRDVAKAVAVLLSIPYHEALSRLNSHEELVKIPFQDRHQAENAQHRLQQEGATAVVAPKIRTDV